VYLLIEHRYVCFGVKHLFRCSAVLPRSVAPRGLVAGALVLKSAAARRGTHAGANRGAPLRQEHLASSSFGGRERGPAVFCNLEDTRLYGLEPADFPTLLLRAGRTPSRGGRLSRRGAEAPDWQRLVRALPRRRRSVCVTGLERLVWAGTRSKLTGRHVSAEVHRFSVWRVPDILATGNGARRPWKNYLEGRRLPRRALREPALLPDVARTAARPGPARHCFRVTRCAETRHLMNLVLHLLAHTGQTALAAQSLAKGLAFRPLPEAPATWSTWQDAWLLLAVRSSARRFKQRVVTPPIVLRD